ncbi:MAG: polyprenyl synthetase family protein [Bacteroidia bacterium]
MNIQLYQEIVSAETEKFSKSIPHQPFGLYEPVRYTLSLGGKRMRPLLTLMGAGLFSEDVTPAIPAAMGIELFHNFTLLHDDIMDNAPLRRGKPTVHARWNPNTAILSGDAMFAQAIREVSKSPHNILPRVLDIFTRTALEVCEGQQLDMDFEQLPKVSIPQYIRMIELKTAVLLAGALEIGALCGGAYSTEAHKLYEFGRHVGIAFQLQDDILDVYGSPEKFGKQVGGDIVSNKKTFLLISALERADRYSLENLQNWIFAPQFEAEEKVSAVKEIYDRLNIRALAETEMMRHYNKGLEYLASIEADDEKKKTLKAFTDHLMIREV